MTTLELRIDRALAFVHAAIEDPIGHPLGQANDYIAELLDELDPFEMAPEIRGRVTQLTTALRTLRHVLATDPVVDARARPLDRPSVS